MKTVEALGTDGLEAVLPERVEEIRTRVRAVVAEHVAPTARRVDELSLFPEDGVRALAAAGLGGLLMPEELGGSGDSTLAYVVAMEEITAACGSTSTVYMTQMHCAHPILIAGDEAQKGRWIPALCAAESFGSLGVTEPEAGSDVASLRTRAVPVADGYRITGSKTFITSGDRADVIVLFATVDPAAGRDGVTAFLVEPDQPGCEVGAPMHKLGMRGSSTVEVFLDGYLAPVESRLGPEGGAWRLSMQSVVKSRLSAAAQGVGLARAALRAASTWAWERGLTRGSAGRHQDTQFRLAEAAARIAAARALLHEAAVLVDDGALDERVLVPRVSAAKLICTECGMSVASAMADLLGEDGDLVDREVERCVRDAKVTEIYDGTNQIQRLLIARSILPRPREVDGG